MKAMVKIIFVCIFQETYSHRLNVEMSILCHGTWIDKSVYVREKKGGRERERECAIVYCV